MRAPKMSSFRWQTIAWFDFPSTGQKRLLAVSNVGANKIRISLESAECFSAITSAYRFISMNSKIHRFSPKLFCHLCLNCRSTIGAVVDIITLFAIVNVNVVVRHHHKHCDTDPASSYNFPASTPSWAAWFRGKQKKKTAETIYWMMC